MRDYIKQLWLPVLLGLLWTAVLFPIGVIYGKGGRETFSIIFFPFTSLLGLFTSPDAPNNLAITLGFILFIFQYPLYCVILKLALDRGKFYNSLLALLGFHIMCSLFGFSIYSNQN